MTGLVVDASFPIQAVVTRYKGPTEHNGARILVTAQCQPRPLVVAWDYGKNKFENHAAAARRFLEKWEWPGIWTAGALPQGNGYAWVGRT